MNATSENESAAAPPAPICCDLCDATQPDTTAAIEAGWVPSYWIDDDEISEPICGKCAENHCDIDDGGELVLRNSSNRQKLAAAIAGLNSAVEILRQLGGPDCNYAAERVAEIVSSEIGAAGLKSLLKIWGRK